MLFKTMRHLHRTYKSQGYHSGTQWAVTNWKLPAAFSHLVLDESKMEQCYLTAYMFIFKMEAIELRLNFVKVSISHRLMNGSFHVPGPRVAVRGSHGSLSSLTGPMLPLNRTPAALAFLQVVARSVAQSCPTLCDPMDCVAHQAPLSMEFSRQEYWSGLSFPSPSSFLFIPFYQIKSA